MALSSKKSILAATALAAMGSVTAFMPAQASQGPAVQLSMLEEVLGLGNTGSANLPGPVSTLTPIQNSESAMDLLNDVALNNFTSLLVLDVESGAIVHQVDVKDNDEFNSVVLVDATTGEVVKTLDSTRN